MICINVRSPYIVSIGDYGGTQTGSRVKLSIYQKGVTPPTSGVGFYSLSKNVPSSTQRETRYNISNYVKEFINHTYSSPQGQTPTNAPVEDWIFVNVELSWYNGATYTVISTTTYIGLDGYTNYYDGANKEFAVEKKMHLLLTPISDLYPRKIVENSVRTFNLIAEVPSAGNKVDVVYSTTYLGSPYTVTVPVILTTDARGVYNKKIRLSIDNTYPQFKENLYQVIIQWFESTTEVEGLSVPLQIIEECKYIPVDCSFINKFGGWELFPFFKAQTNSISVKGTDYKLTQTALNYNNKIGQFKTFNTNGKQTVKLNTGFVEEIYSELITELLLSEAVLLIIYGIEYPVTVKTSSSDLKTTLKDKNINYEIEFEYAFNLINDVV